jgi:hypothetical protein
MSGHLAVSAMKTRSAIRAALAKKNRPGVRKIAAANGISVGLVQRVTTK